MLMVLAILVMAFAGLSFTIVMGGLIYLQQRDGNKIDWSLGAGCAGLASLLLYFCAAFIAGHFAGVVQ